MARDVAAGAWQPREPELSSAEHLSQEQNTRGTETAHHLLHNAYDTRISNLPGT
jgi:hypothetical protein